MANFITAYSDESGNTGNNLFDVNQPYFWTGTLLSEKDLQINGEEKIFGLAEKVGVRELHGNELGFDKLEKIAAELQDFIIQNDLRFIFTMVEKRHVATLKFFDMLMDSGINHAVSSIHYGNRFLRQSLALFIVNRNFSERNQEDFWDAYKTGDVNKFKHILYRVKWNVENKVNDPRARQLLLDAIFYAIKNPDKFLENKLNLLDSPNMVAFSLLVHGLHSQLKNTDYKITKFIHDEQNQFVKSMKIIYGYFKKIKFNTETFSWMTDIEHVETYLTDLETMRSDMVVGLQIIDVILWLIKRYYDKLVPDKRYQNIDNLINCVLVRTSLNIFSKEQLNYDVEKGKILLMNTPLTEDRLQNGKVLLSKFESQRKSRMLITE